MSALRRKRLEPAVGSDPHWLIAAREEGQHLEELGLVRPSGYCAGDVDLLCWLLRRLLVAKGEEAARDAYLLTEMPVEFLPSDLQAALWH